MERLFVCVLDTFPRRLIGYIMLYEIPRKLSKINKDKLRP